MRVRAILVLAVVCVSVVCIGSTVASNPGDIYQDNKVDWLDVKIIGDEWLSDGNTPADIDNSGDVNGVDFAILANNWGWVGPPNDMVYIPGGTFQMGDSFSEGPSNERPVHTVMLDSFYMSKYEATNGQYCQYLNSALGSSIYVSDGKVYGSGNNQPYCDTSTRSPYSQIDYNDMSGTFSVRTKPAVGGRDMSNDPMVQVSWCGSIAYCNWRSQQEGKELCYNLSTWTCDFNKKGYRLATEAEWEYAARGGLSGRRFPWGDTITHSQANYFSSSSNSYDISPTRDYHPIWNDGIHPYTSVVGSFQGNAFGLYDMAGNVWEWCNDWYSSTYYSTTPYPHVNPTGPTSGTRPILRGGGWASFASGCRVTVRNYYGVPDTRHLDDGFRVALNF
jgi:formylglycine-generating enzyme required for sulfatase activity